MTRILIAETEADIAASRQLFLEYADSLGFDLCFQGFEAELAHLPGDYAPPSGRLLLAQAEAEVAGCIALRRFDLGTGEVKRLYVRPAHRGSGLGARLVAATIEAARSIGYKRLVLDTLPTMTAAAGIYRHLGFVETDPYYPNPIPGARYFTLSLEP